MKSTSEDSSALTTVNAHTRLHVSKVPYEIAQEDGSARRPNGFVESLEHISDNPRSAPPHIAGSIDGKPVRENPVSEKSAFRKKQKVVKFPKPGKQPKVKPTARLLSPPTPLADEVKAIRDRYLPTLAETPFWRPLLSVTVSTRPLATTLARLSRALSRGLPFHASINNDDRKTYASYSARMRSMRLDRMENLTVQIAELLAGARGGFIGIRFGTKERGRGIRGQGLEAPIAKENRTIKIGVGNWYRHAAEVKEAFREDAITHIGEVGVGLDDIGETFEIIGLDDHGKRIDDKTGEVIPWPESKPFNNLDVMNEFLMKDLDSEDEDLDIVDRWMNENAKRREKKIKRQEVARSHMYEIASHLAQKHRSVMAP